MLKPAVIEEKKLKHGPRVGADNPLGTKIFMSTGRSLWSFIASLKRISSTSDFIHIFSWFNRCIQPQVKGRQHQGTKFWCHQKPLVTSIICYKLKNKSLWSLILYNLFHDFIHVYSRRSAVNNPRGKQLMSTETSCHFAHLLQESETLFEVWFFTFSFFIILYMYIAPGQGLGDEILMSSGTSCHFGLLLQVSKQSLWSLILYNFSWFYTCT